MRPIYTFCILALFCIYASVNAHSWIDCIDTNREVVYKKSNEYIFGGSHGNGKCKGYGLNYPGRGNSDINTLYTFKTLYNKVQEGAPLCQYSQGHYGGWRHRLKAKTGERVYFSYLPNGHVAKDKTARGTKYGIYWSKSTTTQLKTTKELTSDNLVDGKLYDFDDGNCGESYEDGNFNGKVKSGRAGNGKPCVGSFIVPQAKPGIYRMVWYWKFYKDGYKNGVSARGYYGAAYSTCFDIEIKSDSNITPSPKIIKTTPPTTTPSPTSVKEKATPPTKKPAQTKPPSPCKTTSMTKDPQSTTKKPVQTKPPSTCKTKSRTKNSKKKDSKSKKGRMCRPKRRTPLPTVPSPQPTTPTPFKTVPSPQASGISRPSASPDKKIQVQKQSSHSEKISFSIVLPLFYIAGYILIN